MADVAQQPLKDVAAGRHADSLSPQLASPRERPRTSTSTRRSFREQSDDLLAQNRHRLWPYCLRLEASPLQKLSEKGAEELPKMELGNSYSTALLQLLSPRKQLPALAEPPQMPLSPPFSVSDKARPPLGRAQSSPMPSSATQPKGDGVEEIKKELQYIKTQLREASSAVERLPPTSQSTLPPISGEEPRLFWRSLQKHELHQQRTHLEREAAAAAERALMALHCSSEQSAKNAARAASRATAAAAAANAEIAMAATQAALAAQAALAQETASRQAQHRTNLARQFLERQVQIECPVCGDLIPAGLLRKHRTQVCRNRLVPCKNAIHGCRVLVRPLNRAWHENADHLLRPRSCLQFPGPTAFVDRPIKDATREGDSQRKFPCGHVAIDEDDVQAPWTAEYWLWRPSVATALRANASATLQHRALWNAIEVDADIVAQRVKDKENFASRAFAGRGRAAIMPSSQCDSVQNNVSACDKISEEQTQLADELVALNEALHDVKVRMAVQRERCFEFARASRHLLEIIERESGAAGVLETLRPLESKHHSESVESRLRNVFAQMDAARQVPSSKRQRLPTKETAAMLPQTEFTKKEKLEKAKRAKLRARRKERLKRKHQRVRQAQHGTSVEERVVALTAGSECRETIAASAKCRLLLSTDVDGKKCGDSETVGIAFPGVGTYSIGVGPLPRETWVHVAFVATEHRNLKVYVNGERFCTGAFTLPALVDELPLPMRDLGSDREYPDGGFQGLLLEARYWATARSKDEIRNYSHALPDADARAQGMIGWWTFEEGESHWLYDRSECRYRSRVEGVLLKPGVEGFAPDLEIARHDDWPCRILWTDAFETSGGQEPPTPASREQDVCQIELRHARLAAKGRELYLLTGCKNEGCREKILRCQMRFHLEHTCAYRPVPCTYCGKSVPYCKMQDHQRHPACPAHVERMQLAELHTSAVELIECDQGCESLVRRSEMERHCKRDCAMRLVQCPQKCGVLVAMCRLGLHTRYFCGHPIFVAARKMAEQCRRDKAYRRAWAELTSVAAADDSGGTPENLLVDDTCGTADRVASTMHVKRDS